jgi:hypothetical protein
VANLSSGQRAWIAVVVLVGFVVAGAAVFFLNLHRPAPAVVSGPLPDLLSQLPGDAPVIAFVDMAALRATEFAAGIESLAPQAKEDPDYREFVRATGFDYARDLDRAAIAAWPSPDERQGPNKILAVADGHFDRKKISGYALRFGRSAGKADRQVFEIPGDSRTGPVSFTFLAPSRIALASAVNVENALAHPSVPPFDPARQARMARVAGAPIFAMARADNLPEQLQLNFGNFDQLRKLLEGIRAIAAAGRPQGQNFEVAADADCDSAMHALQLATLLDGLRVFGRAALSDPKTRGQMAREQVALLETLLRTASVSHDGHWVRINLEITQAMLPARIAYRDAH